MISENHRIKSMLWMLYYPTRVASDGGMFSSAFVWQNKKSKNVYVILTCARGIQFIPTSVVTFLTQIGTNQGLPNNGGWCAAKYQLSDKSAIKPSTLCCWPTFPLLFPSFHIITTLWSLDRWFHLTRNDFQAR